jgi:hypothetical protein
MPRAPSLPSRPPAHSRAARWADPTAFFFWISRFACFTGFFPLCASQVVLFVLLIFTVVGTPFEKIYIKKRGEGEIEFDGQSLDFSFFRSFIF